MRPWATAVGVGNWHRFKGITECDDMYLAVQDSEAIRLCAMAVTVTDNTMRLPM